MRKVVLKTADVLLLFVLALVLIWPLARIEYLDNWGSIDSTFIADARFLEQHWPHPLWQPLWYCGTRFDYIYPPALRYSTAALAMGLGISPARAYHLYTALCYALGIAGVYLLARAGGAGRRWGWLAATGAAVLSPSFLLMHAYRDDSLLHMPQRLNVLVKWGEGPHMTALAVLPFALACSWRAIREGGGTWVAASAALCALVVANNFYGAVALAFLFPALAWSLAITHGERRMFARAAAIAVLAYGLVAFWLVPSYIRITLANLRFVAQPGHAWSRWVALGAAAAFLAASAKLARGRKERAYAVFVCGAALAFGVVVIGHYYLNFRVVAEPHRFVPELDLVLILAAAEGLRRLASRKAAWSRMAAVAVVGISFGACWPYLSRPWAVFVADHDYRRRVEYRLADWIARNFPHARTFTTGSLRLWYNAWQDGAQVGGGSEQGLLNELVPLAEWQVIRGDDAARDVAWLVGLGAGAVVVHEPKSSEMFHEVVHPRKFAGLLPALYDDGEGDIIYRVPRRWPDQARVVQTRRMEALAPIPYGNHDRAALEAYAAVVEGGSDSQAVVMREGPDAIRVQARLGAGESLLVQESYDPAWHAYANGRPLAVRKDVMGFLWIDAPTGEQDVRLVFELPRENVAGRAISGIAAALVLALGLRRMLG